jgi:hypothetical protein
VFKNDSWYWQETGLKIAYSFELCDETVYDKKENMNSLGIGTNCRGFFYKVPSTDNNQKVLCEKTFERSINKMIKSGKKASFLD